MMLNLFGKSSINKNGKNKRRDSDKRLRLGDCVQSCKYGNGTVQALGPNGNVMVHFKANDKTLAVYPTLLVRVVA